ncbi:MAG TPA: DUF1501 domain-containing protein [Pirellulales bacterium]|nr:DUF1501 domain-containing protein [Pirellulales bacterium]
MSRRRSLIPPHPGVSRRVALQAGALGLVGLGSNHLAALRAASPTAGAKPRALSCIYIFLSGGLAQHESFDLKPHAPAEIRGEFEPIATATPGIEICEHLPLLAARSNRWALVRSLTHWSNSHTDGHFMMLTGRSDLPPGFGFTSEPKSTDWPSITSMAGYNTPPRSDNLPPAVVLPERLVHWSGRVLPGAYGGQMGRRREPWFIEASPYGNPFWRGAYPEYTFPNETKKPPAAPDDRVYQAPNLSLPQGLSGERFGERLAVLTEIDRQRSHLERAAEIEKFDTYRQSAISLLADAKVRRAIDVTAAEPAIQDRYGRNSFGWSLLMAYRLVEAGVNLVQVNLGNNETWDTHGDAFPRLKDKLLPPTDKALSALLDDLEASGLLQSTMVVMAGEFGRTPKLSTLPQSFGGPGRDHWGAVQTVFFAGAGVRGGTVVGSSDKDGGHPASSPQKPENMAATIYHALGIPATAVWHDDLERPHPIYHGEPIHGLLA